MRATILSGSSRSKNNTLRVSKAFQKLLDEKNIEVDLIDFRDYDLQFFNGEEVDIDRLTPFQKKLVDSWDRADLVIVVSPEYNWFPSAELVNMLHQLGDKPFAHLFDEKVFAFAGVSSGRGGRLPGMQLSAVFEKLISFLHKYSVCSPAKFESHYSPQELSESGEFTDENIYQKSMKHFIDYNVNLTLKFRQ